jgi:hypothetical protein
MDVNVDLSTGAVLLSFGVAMRARFIDPDGRKLWRRLTYLIPFLFLWLGSSDPFDGTVWETALPIFSIALFHLIGIFPNRQTTPRDALIACGPGYIDVRNAGTRSQRIHAREIVGATTTRTAEGLLLTLQHRKRSQPITVVVESEADVEKIRLALGIGHDGFGTVAWRTANDKVQTVALVGRLVTTALALVTTMMVLGSSEGAAGIAGVFLAQFGTIGAILGLIGLLASRGEPSIVMGADGLRLRTPRGWFAIPYDAVYGLEDGPGSFIFRVPPPYNAVAIERVGTIRGGIGPSEGAILRAQIDAASQRARGLGPRKDDVSGRLDMLRRNGESARAWLVRLDMAGQMLSAGPGYRGNTLDVNDLWAILEDPDAEPDLRAAAARVLRHAPNTRVRIDAALAATREEAAHKKLRIAIQDDIDEASVELAELDASAGARRAWAR